VGSHAVSPERSKRLHGITIRLLVCRRAGVAVAKFTSVQELTSRGGRIALNGFHYIRGRNPDKSVRCIADEEAVVVTFGWRFFGVQWCHRRKGENRLT
jgi:hypothetical protein